MFVYSIDQSRVQFTLRLFVCESQFSWHVELLMGDLISRVRNKIKKNFPYMSYATLTSEQVDLKNWPITEVGNPSAQ